MIVTNLNLIVFSLLDITTLDHMKNGSTQKKTSLLFAVGMGLCVYGVVVLHHVHTFHS